MNGEKTQFKLKHNSWKDQFIIKGFPVEHWSMKFKLAGWPSFTLNKNPLEFESEISGIKKKENQNLYNLKGVIPVGKFPNSNKKIPMNIDNLDEGSINIIKDSENLMHVEFSGEKLKGNWIFKRSNPASNVWNVSKAKIPKKKSMREFGAPLSKEEIKNIHFLSENKVGVSEISKILDRPNSTIYDWQEKLNLRSL